MNHFRAVLALLIAGIALPAMPAFGQAQIPDALEPWRDWVLFGQEFRACPVLNGRDANQEASHICAWPGELGIAVEVDGARFEQNWTLYKEEWVPLPGDGRYWPGGVTVDGTAQAAVLRGGRATVRVPAGAHRIAGELNWESRPASIPVPTQTALIALTLDGTAVPLPELEGGVLWLGLRPDLVLEEDRLNVEVYRRLTDSIPIRVETRIQFDVAGQSRELELDGALLPDFVGESLTAQLPAELDADGMLRIQVRPGRWVASLIAHRSDVTAGFTRPPIVAPWPNDEVWSFDSNPTLRVAVLEGAPAIDSQRAGVPPDWRNLPSYAVAPAATVNLIERSRNDADDDNQLRLTRLAWLDFDGGGVTVQDTVTGQMHSEWRLDMAPPYTMTMAAIGRDNLLVTEGTEPGTQGVELRTPNLNLTTTARLPSLTGLPVTGYTEDFNSASLVLYLPPAHRLIAAPGADQAAGAWIERWRLLDIFLALIIAVASWRLFGPVGGGIALATMVLVYHEPWAPRYAWLNLLLITALLRVVPVGKIRNWCARYRFLSLAALLLLLIPFVSSELSVVLFPQLEQSIVQRNIAARDLAVTSAFQVDELQSLIRPGVAGRENQRAAEETVIVTGSRIDRADFSVEPPAGAIEGQLSRYQPGALVQTGPGLPDWAWSRYALEFNGPITPEQTYSAIVIGPWLMGLWRVASVALVLAFAWLLLKPEGKLPQRNARGGATSAATIVLAVIASALPGPGSAQETDSFPSAQLLNELRQRLTEPAPCHPACAELTNATVNASATALTIELEIALQDAVAVPMPGDTEGWRPAAITVDGSNRRTLFRDDNGRAWLTLDAGVRAVRLAGPIPTLDSLTLPFPLTPRRITVVAPGWDIAGVSEGRLPSGALELIRQRQAEDGDDDVIQATAFPPFVQVVRSLQFALDWTAVTSVRRISPDGGAFTIGIELLPNEAVVTQDIEVENGVATIAFAAGQSTVSWQSRLPTAAALSVTAGADVPWSEVWQFSAGHEWHAEYDGLPATRTLASGNMSLVTEYLPRPGESLTVNLTRPEPVSGDTIAIDSVDYTRSIGDRASTSTLGFVYRSTRAVEHPITLPVGSELDSVTIDGRSVPLQLDGNLLSIPVTPGEHSINVSWRNLEGVSLHGVVLPIDLGTGASNITLHLNLPQDRWTLFTFGPILGPAVLYWAELAVFVLAAVILGKLTFSPLQTHEWLLLGLGLSTFSWPVLLLFAVWIFLLSWRSGNTIDGPPYLFNAGQIALGLLTLITLITLISSIANGLLGSPNMHIVSPVRGGDLSWFIDRSAGVTPPAGAVSVSLWFYKAAMLGWALWLSFAVLRWLRFAWTAFSFDGIWRGKVKPGL